jgi:predicted amidohydrolase YtcJ
MGAMVVLKNGRIYTQDRARSLVQAIAILGGRIVATGSDDEMMAISGPGSEIIDLDGRCVIPGLVDAHVHFQSFSLALQRIDLAGSKDVQNALARVAAAAGNDPGNDWLEGRGWNQAEWPGARFPTAVELDTVTGDRPALLVHRSGHAAWANTRALQLAAITASTPDPAGGQIQRDTSGRPTGILFEKAIDLLDDFVPRPSENQTKEAMRLGQETCLRAGLTGIHDFDGRTCFRALQALHQGGELTLRVVKNIRVRYLDHAIGLGLKSGFGDEWLRIGGVKMFADGALGPRTALMLAPYEGEPENRGIVVTDKEEMMDYASRASAAGLSLTVHAIGDRANHDVLDVYEAVRAEEQARGSAGLRHRIEHFQIAHPLDFQRLADLNVVASMQPIHATSDMEMADRHWGDRAENSYAWRRVLDTGGLLVFGSDAPVEPIEPLAGIHAAVTRRRADGSPGPEGWRPEQRLTIDEAIRGFTMGPAEMTGQQAQLGSISPGKLADLTIFDRDIYQVVADDLLNVQIAGTMVGGTFRYRTW